MENSMLGKLVKLMVTVPNNWLGTLVDLFEKLLAKSIGIDDLKRFVRKELCWIEGRTVVTWTVDADGNIHLRVVSSGMNPLLWQTYLEHRNWNLTSWLYNVLSRASDAPTNNMIYHVLICLDKKWIDNSCTMKNMREYGSKNGWKTPHWEVACLIRDTISDEQMKEMGVSRLVTMHEPIKDSEDMPNVLVSWRGSVGGFMETHYAGPGEFLSKDDGFVFVVSQVPRVQS